MRSPDSVQDKSVRSNSYRMILPMYNSNNRFLLRAGFNQLKQDMGFIQIRFYCFKKNASRVVHIMTTKNSTGMDVVKFFTTSDTMPVACGSFTRLPDDNSSLAANCDKWGYPLSNRWGHSSHKNNVRLFLKPMAWAFTKFFRIIDTNFYKCDDKVNIMSLGDTWQIFVR